MISFELNSLDIARLAKRQHTVVIKQKCESMLLSITFEAKGYIICVNDPSAGSPTETLLRLLLPLNDQVWINFSDLWGRLPDLPEPVRRPTEPFNR